MIRPVVAVDLLIELLKDPSEEVRLTAHSALEEMMYD